MTNDEKLRDYLKRVTVDLHDARLRLRELEGQGSEPVAIVGMSCRYPGVSSPEELWELVSSGGDGISEFPSNRGWDLERLYDPDPDRAGTTYVREGGFVHDVTDFDADFFSISPREALAMDPQQRALLEASWEAIESAGIEPLSLQGSQTGVFVGGATNGYGVGSLGTAGSSESVDGHYGSGTLSSIMSGRVAYALGIEGPALTIDTACSSSLVALHLACDSLRAGESSLALVGGVNFMPTPITFLELSRQRGLAPDGRCKPYADSADGTGWSEGVGVLLLERLSEARRRGHRVLASIRGSAVNQDGASNGLTAPNGPSQQRVIRRALANAGLSARDVDAVEGHGTGTMLGDPIEAQALLATYGQDRPEARPLWLGSIKSNIGHTQAAAGVAGVIKMVMALQHEVLPRTLHVDRPSKQVNWSAGHVSLLLDAVPWPQGSEPRRAGVSSFGASGTNAHVILEEAQAVAPDPEQALAQNGSPTVDRGLTKVGSLQTTVVPVLVSARGEDALRGQAARLASFMGAEPSPPIGDVGLSLTRRSTFDQRAVVIGEERGELVAGLDAIAAGGLSANVLKGAVGPSGAGGVVFVFPGQGSQWVGMALELMDSSSVFSERLEECSQALAPFIDFSLEEVLRGAENAPGLERIDVVQPALFAVMVALAALWGSCGVRPDAVVGHSQGEIAAAHIAGAIPLEQAARMVALRSKMLTRMVGHGGVVSVALALEQVHERLERWDGRLVVSGSNGPCSVAVAGDREALREFVQECVAQDVRAREIPATVATHSSQVEVFHDEVIEAFSEIEPRPSDIAFYSTVTGGLVDGAQLDAKYWYRNLREPVQFELVTRALLEEGYRTFVEVSPHPVLAVGLHETIEASSIAGVGVHGSLRRDDGGPRRFLTSLSELWVRGIEVDWDAVFEGSGASLIELPTYAFQRKRYWLDMDGGTGGDVSTVGQTSAEHPLLGATVSLAGSDGWLFTGRISLKHQPWFADHMVGELVVVPGTTFVEIALRAGTEVESGVLQDLVFETPLVLKEQGAVRIQVALGAADESGQRTVEIFSHPEGAMGAEEQTWSRHARGTLISTSSTGLTPLEQQAQVLAANSWPPPGAEPVAVEDLYDYFAGVGLEYGPSFLSVRAAWRRGNEAFTEVRLPESQRLSARDYGIHPALLDCALQTGGVLMRVENPATPESAVLPFAWSSVRLHSSGTSSLRVRLSRLETGGMSVLAADEHGQPVLSAESVVVRKVNAEQLRGLGGTERHSLLHLEWVPVASADAKSSPADSSIESIAVLGERTLGCLRVSDWGQIAEGDDGAPIAYPSVKALDEALAQGALAPDTVLVYFGQETLTENIDTPIGAARQILASGLSLLQEWLAAERLAGSRLIFTTRGAVAATAEDGIADLASASLWGLLRSAQSENPGRFGLVDLDDADVSTSVLTSALAVDEPQLALRGEELLAARLRRVQESGGGDPAIGFSREGEPGTVLITGGTGALGSLLARHLVEHYGVRSLVLASRQGMQAPVAERLRAELVELGAEVAIVACDVSDRKALGELIDSTPSEYPLSAVVHTAGALDDGVIESMTSERLANVFMPKAEAAWHLHELTEKLDLSAFILFSSSTGTLGGPAQSNYAAANASLDALAIYRGKQGLPGISMAWGWWAAAEGLAGDLSAADHTRMERAGMLALSAEEGLALFDAAYAAGEHSIIPARLDTNGLRTQARGGLVPPLLRGLVRTPAQRQDGVGSLLRRLTVTPASERERVMLDLVSSEVASVLGHDSADAIDPHRAFNELGFDSLAAVELRNRLVTASSLQLPATLVFDHPTAAELADFLLEQLSQEIGESSNGGATAGELEIRNALAAIPLTRLREAGVMDTLLRLAGLGEEPSTEAEEDSVDSIDEMDVESLVKMTLEDDGVLGKSEVRS